MKTYVYGWYCYTDGSQRQFRYPVDKEANLKQDGKAVTVEIHIGESLWLKRRGFVQWGGGNFMVVSVLAK